MTEPIHQPVASLSAPENEPDIDTSENEAVASIISTRNPMRFLDLPLELRFMIYRHLLVRPHSLEITSVNPGPRLSVNVLRTSKLVHREASDVLYRENRFTNCAMSPYECLTPFPRILDAIQNTDVGLLMKPQGFLPLNGFLRFMHYFGAPSITRDTLRINFAVLTPRARPVEGFRIPLRWLRRSLGRFTNFRTVELQIWHDGVVQDRFFDMLDFFEAALAPVLGPAETSAGPRDGLRFHPLDHRNRTRDLRGGDWADFLDGIRLGWNQD